MRGGEEYSTLLKLVLNALINGSLKLSVNI